MILPASTRPRTSLAVAADTVQFGCIRRSEAIGVLHGDCSPRPRLYNGRSEYVTSDPTSWAGGIDDKLGLFVIGNPYRAGVRMTPTGLGLCHADIETIVSIFSEVDERPDGSRMSIADQAVLYDDIEAETGLRFGLAVLSGDAREGVIDRVLGQEGFDVADLGIDPSQVSEVQEQIEVVEGKSLHGDILIEPVAATPENLALRQRAADALCLLVGGDLAVRDVARKRRLPSAYDLHGDKLRVQTTIRAEAVRYDLHHVVDVLEAACRRRGWDIARGLDAFKRAGQARKAALVYRDLGLNEQAAPLEVIATALRTNRTYTSEQAIEINGAIDDLRERKGFTPPNGPTSGGGGGGGRGGRHRVETLPLSALPDAGRVQPGGRTVPTRCPSPGHDDHAASAFLAMTPDGRLYASCPQVCGMTWWDESAVRLPVVASGSVGFSDLDLEPVSSHLLVGCKQQQAGHGSGEVEPSPATTPAAGRTLEVSGRYLNAEEIKAAAEAVGAGVVVIRAGRGRGKSTLAGVWASGFQSAGGRVVGSSPTMTLCRALSRTLKVPCYLDLPKDNYRVGGDLVVCTPSMHRARQWSLGAAGELVYDEFDLLVLDEVEQQIRSLAGRHLGDAEAQRAWSSLVARVRHARMVMMLDADAGPLTKALLSAAGRKDILWVNAPGDAPRTWTTYPRRSALMDQITGWVTAGERVAVHCRSERYARSLGRKMATEHVSRKIVVLTPKTIGKHDITDLSWMATVDVLIYSPVLGTGVSIDAVTTGKWDHLVAFCAEHTGTADDVLQGVGRVRDMDTVHIWGPRGSRPDRWEISPAEVYRRWMVGDNAARRKLGITREVPDDVIESGVSTEYTRVMATAYANDRARGAGWQYSALLLLVAENGETIVEAGVPEKATMAEQAEVAATTAAREEVKKEDAEEKVDAKDIDHDEAVRLREKVGKSQDEAASLARFGLTTFYGTKFTDQPRDQQVELVIKDDDGRHRMRLRRFGWLRAQIEGGVVRGALADLDRHDLVVEGISPVRLHARSQQARVVQTLLAKAGLLNAVSSHLASGGKQQQAGHGTCPDGSVLPDTATVCPDGSVVLDADTVAAAAKWAAENRATLQMVGITCRWDAEKKPMSWLQDLLRSIGLATHGLGSTRTGRRGEQRKRTYYLDLEDVDEAVKLSDHYYRGLLGGVDRDDEEGDPREAEWVEYMARIRETALAVDAAMLEWAA